MSQESTCPVCGQAIQADESLLKTEHGWIHKNCFDDSLEDEEAAK